MGNFFTEIIQKDSRYRTTKVIKDLDLLEPVFRVKVDELVTAARAEGTELVPVETFRSAERQAKVFRDGKSKLSRVGTHHYGLAVDFAKRIDGKLSWEGDWAMMPRLAGALNLTSLYPNDAGHVQGCTVAQQRGLFAGTWYPGDDGGGVGPVAPIPATLSPAAKPADPPDDLTAVERAALVAADAINSQYFQSWFLRSSMMAFMEIESAFDPRAYRLEPSGVASYGLFQVLDDTAEWLGHEGDPEDLYDPEVGIFYGLKFLAWGWNYLLGHFGRPPTLIEWAAGYNIGYGAIVKGRSRDAYTTPWLKARDKWSKLD